jgi:SAM-dependent methyltransferase
VADDLSQDRRPASTEAMRDFWDQRARENAMWYIDSQLDFKDPDAAEFWRSGEAVLDDSLKMFDLSLGKSQRVLEIGCGMGRVTRAIAARVESVVGIDIAPEMIERGREALADLGNVELMVGNGRDLAELGDGSFDVCYSFVVFQHIPDPEVTCRYVTEMGRVLKPGGWALFQVSDAPAIHRADTWENPGFRERLAARLGRAPRGCMEPQWLGSAVPRDRLLDALAAGRLELAGTVGDGTQYCMILARRP